MIALTMTTNGKAGRNQRSAFVRIHGLAAAGAVKTGSKITYLSGSKLCPHLTLLTICHTNHRRILRIIALLAQFVGVHVPSFSCVGTPWQLRSFLDAIRMGSIVPQYKARVCFDLDRSLLAVNSGGAASESVSIRPVKRNVLLLQVIT